MLQKQSEWFENKVEQQNVLLLYVCIITYIRIYCICCAGVAQKPCLCPFNSLAVFTKIVSIRHRLMIIMTVFALCFWFFYFACAVWLFSLLQLKRYCDRSPSRQNKPRILLLLFRWRNNVYIYTYRSMSNAFPCVVRIHVTTTKYIDCIIIVHYW